MFVDFGVSNDCINIDSYGEICVGCGCCSRNPDYRDRIIRKIRLYKQYLQAEKVFNGWISGWEDAQRRNVKLNIIYFSRKIRFYKKILRTLRRNR